MAIPPRALVADYHMSNTRQGTFGLKLDVQREVVRRFFADGASQLVDEFTEVKSGKRAVRSEVVRATHASRIYGATLVSRSSIATAKTPTSCSGWKRPA